MKRIGPLAGVLLVFILAALALIKIYDKGKNEKPLIYAEIPQGTIDWINSLGNDLSGLLSSFNPFPRPTPWGNDDDLGQDPASGLKTLEDEYFIFYFPESLAPTARRCQEFAHEAIPHLKDIIGRYYYPDDMNGRKVPVYLLPGQQESEDFMEHFSGKGNYEQTSGITIQEISPSGYYLKAIGLNGRYAFSDEAYTKNVLWHELTHYCFFASVDYNQQIDLPMWCYEGIAEYTSLPGKRPTFSEKEIEMMRADCDFSAEHFPYVFENYAGGHSIFAHMQDRYRIEGLKAFLQTMYEKGISSSLNQHFSISTEAFEADWKANLEKFEE